MSSPRQCGVRNRSRPCIRLQSLNSSDVDGCLFPRVVPRMVAWVMHGQRRLGSTRVTATFFNTYSPTSGCAMCAARHFLLDFLLAFLLGYRLSTARAKGR